jgi:hypothetical protein
MGMDTWIGTIENPTRLLCLLKQHCKRFNSVMTMVNDLVLTEKRVMDSSLHELVAIISNSSLLSNYLTTCNISMV